MNQNKKSFGRLPGDLSKEELIARIIRVDQAGEYGAKRIYEGQLSVLSGTKDEPVLQHMADQEQEHIETFQQLIVSNRVRPTALLPVWNVAGYALGAATAMMGEKAAMACTVAVEEVIEEHYSRQAAQLASEEEPEILEIIERFRKDEAEHKETALLEGAENAPGYPFLASAVKSCSRVAIWLSERI